MVRPERVFFVTLFLSSLTFSQAYSLAGEMSERFEINLPLGGYVTGKKQIEFTKEERDLKTFCKKKGYSDYESIGKNDEMSTYFVVCTGEAPPDCESIR